MKELRVEVAVKNNRLWHFIFDRHQNVAQFCRETGFNQVIVGKLLNLTAPIYRQRYPSKAGPFEICYRPVVIRISEYFGELPDVLFPDELYQNTRPKRGAVEFTSYEAARFLTTDENPGIEIEETEIKRGVDGAVESLGSRLSDIVKLRFGLAGNRPHTLSEISEKYHLTDARIQFLVEKAIRRLRMGSNKNGLRRLLADEKLISGYTKKLMVRETVRNEKRRKQMQSDLFLLEMRKFNEEMRGQK